jgi:hypothetical protein
MNSFLCKRCEWLCTVGYGIEKFCYLAFSESTSHGLVFYANGKFSENFKIAQKCPYILEHIVSAEN